ncbi:MAG: hypothetical protein V3V41_07000 [Candidatus Heimdallarchaeota archaeon]
MLLARVEGVRKRGVSIIEQIKVNNIISILFLIILFFLHLTIYENDLDFVCLKVL